MRQITFLMWSLLPFSPLKMGLDVPTHEDYFPKCKIALKKSLACVFVVHIRSESMGNVKGLVFYFPQLSNVYEN